MKNLLSARIHFPLVKHTLKKQKNLLFIFTLLLSITFPFTIVVRLIGSQPHSLESTRVMLYFFTVILLLCIPFIFFNYLTSKRSVDFMHALPIKRRDLYATFAFLSFLFVLIPFTFAYWSGYFLLYGYNGLSFSMNHILFFMRSILLFGAIQSTTLFVIMNTGTTSDSIIYAIILFIAPFIVYGAYEAFASIYIVGVESFSSSNLLLYLSPTAALVEVNSPSLATIHPNKILLFWIVATIIANAITMKLYECWKSERSELPFNNPVFFNLVTSLFVAFFLIFSMSIFSLDSSSKFKFLAIQNLLLPILMSFVLYVSLDTIRLRSFRKISKSIKRYSLIVLTTLSITLVVYVTQGFGYSRDLPHTDSIESVTISTTLGYTDPLFFNSNESKLVFTSDSDFALILDIHQELVDSFAKSNRFFSSYQYQSTYYPDLDSMDSTRVSFDYQLENGKHFKRSFYLPMAMNEIMYPLLKTTTTQKVLQPVLNDAESIQSLTLFNNTMQESYDFDKDALVSALKKEYFALPLEAALTGKHNLEYILAYSHDNTFYQISIDDRYPETLKLLQDRKNPKKWTFETYYSEADDIETNYGIPRAGWFPELENKKYLEVKDIEVFKDSLSSIAMDAKKHPYLSIILTDEFADSTMFIPIQ